MNQEQRIIATALLSALVLAGCGGRISPPDRRTLTPGENPFGPEHPLYVPQPHRDHPAALALTPDGSRLYVALRGSVDEPGDQVAVVDTAKESVLTRITVGSHPGGLAVHPSGRFLVVANAFSNWASVIDTATSEVISEVPIPFYTIQVAFTPDGRRAYFTNRWTDSVLRWDVEVGEDGFAVTGDNYSATEPGLPVGIPVGTNPRDLAVSADGNRLFVAALTGLSVSIIDVASEEETRRVDLRSPPGDILVAGADVFVTHTGDGTHHPPDEGFDTDGDGAPGDSTANVMFQDLQNEIAVLSVEGDRVHSYTSDTMCCFDYRDVDPDDPDRGLALPAPDTWPPTRVPFLPPTEDWIVGCALPERMAVTGSRLLVACSGSNEVQSFDIAAGGALVPREAAGALFVTGMNPLDIVAHPDGTRAFVAEHLGEHVTVLDLSAGPGSERRILVGDVSGGEFPATDAEIGEAINFVTAGFTVDGDQTCVHCHREGGNLGKPVAMPLQDNTVWGVRMQMAYRGAFDTRPWFFESSMDETNFFPVINEFARKENFCCEQLDPLIWPGYPSLASCVADDTQPGCEHVLGCATTPPPECVARPYGSPHVFRNEHFRAAAMALIGSERTFGDALFEEILMPDGTTERRGILLDFDGVTRALGLFLLQEPRLLPNPWAALEHPAAARGRAIFESPSTGCATCHPLPVTAVSTTFNPFDVLMRFPAVITPRETPAGDNADGVNPLFLGTFPDTEMGAEGIRFGVPQLRGIWDRSERLFHDGRAHGLREALASPGHPALLDDEVGFNHTFGMPDTHGATSHLSPEELADLVFFIRTL